LRRSTSSAAGNDLRTTAKYLRGAANIGLGTTGNGLSTTTKYLVNQNVGAGSNWAKGQYLRPGHEFY
jgi:hypothetical protein